MNDCVQSLEFQGIYYKCNHCDRTHQFKLDDLKHDFEFKVLTGKDIINVKLPLTFTIPTSTKVICAIVTETKEK